MARMKVEVPSPPLEDERKRSNATVNDEDTGKKVKDLEKELGTAVQERKFLEAHEIQKKISELQVKDLEKELGTAVQERKFLEAHEIQKKISELQVKTEQEHVEGSAAGEQPSASENRGDKETSICDSAPHIRRVRKKWPNDVIVIEDDDQNTSVGGVTFRENHTWSDIKTETGLCEEQSKLMTVGEWGEWLKTQEANEKVKEVRIKIEIKEKKEKKDSKVKTEVNHVKEEVKEVKVKIEKKEKKEKKDSKVKTEVNHERGKHLEATLTQVKQVVKQEKLEQNKEEPFEDAALELDDLFSIDSVIDHVNGEAPDVSVESDTEYNEINSTIGPQTVIVQLSGQSIMDGKYDRLPKSSRGRPCYFSRKEDKIMYLYWDKMWKLCSDFGSSKSLAKIKDVEGLMDCCEPYPHPWRVYDKDAKEFKKVSRMRVFDVVAAPFQIEMPMPLFEAFPGAKASFDGDDTAVKVKLEKSVCEDDHPIRDADKSSMPREKPLRETVCAKSMEEAGHLMKDVQAAEAMKPRTVDTAASDSSSSSSSSGSSSSSSSKEKVASVPKAVKPSHLSSPSKTKATSVASSAQPAPSANVVVTKASLDVKRKRAEEELEDMHKKARQDAKHEAEKEKEALPGGLDKDDRVESLIDLRYGKEAICKGLVGTVLGRSTSTDATRVNVKFASGVTLNLLPGELKKLEEATAAQTSIIPYSHITQPAPAEALPGGVARGDRVESLIDFSDAVGTVRKGEVGAVAGKSTVDDAARVKVNFPSRPNVNLRPGQFKKLEAAHLSLALPNAIQRREPAPSP